MFKLDQTNTFTWPVEVAIADNGGKFKKEAFDVEFKRVPSSELEQIATDVAAGKIGDPDICRQVVVGWGGVTDGGSELQFSPANLDRLLQFPGAARSICQAFVDANKGSAAKN